MSALLEERSKRQQGREKVPDSVSKAEGQKSLDSLVESVKRKSHGLVRPAPGNGGDKRRNRNFSDEVFRHGSSLYRDLIR